MAFEAAYGLADVGPSRCDAQRGQRELAGELSVPDFKYMVFEAAYPLSVFGFDGCGCLRLRLPDSGSLDSQQVLCCCSGQGLERLVSHSNLRSSARRRSALARCVLDSLTRAALPLHD